jgi:transposase
MRQITEIMRLKFEAKLSNEKVARACGVSKGVVCKYLHLVAARGISWPLPEGTDEAQLERLLFPATPKPSRFAKPDYFQVHQELKRKGVTLQLLWAEHVAVHEDQAYRYSQYCHHYRQWCKKQRRSMRQVHRAGEKTFIDYCGPTVPVICRHTGEIRQAQVFVAVLGASSYTYAEATWTQSLPDWVASHQRMFRFYGGVTELQIPDNLLAGVTDANRYTPAINTTYAEMAAHYQTAVLPARPRKPKDKAKAEVAVQIVERWILARLRHHSFFSLPELNKAIAELLPALNERHFQGQTVSRRDLYEQLDAPALRPLPAQPYEYAEWCGAKPGIDYHISVNKRFYSVPHALVGQVLDVRLTAETVEVLHKGKRVAVHARYGPLRFSTLVEHMPRLHRAHREWSPGRFLNWAQDIGPCTRQVVQQQLENRPHPEHGYRACLGLLNLARRYSKARLESACERALAIRSINYQSIASILKQGLDQQTLEGDAHLQDDLPLHDNVRGAGYYH